MQSHTGMRLLLLVAAHGLVPSIRKAPLKYRATADDLDLMREALDLAQTVTADTTAETVGLLMGGSMPLKTAGAGDAA